MNGNGSAAAVAGGRRARRRPGRAVLAALLLVAAVPGPIAAVSYYLATDVPSVLGVGAYTSAQILRSDNGTYSIALDTEGAVFKAIHRRPDGLWLIAEGTPDKIGSVFFEPRDVFLTDASSFFSMYFDGSAAGVPEYAGIDAIFLDGAGALVLSFDVPVNLGGTEYGPSDLVRYSGGTFSLFWSAAAAGVPPYANVVGADRDSAGILVLTFDVPTRLGGTDYLPGQLVAWNGGTSFGLYFADPRWPLSSQLRGFAFVPAAGALPDGGGVPGTPLTVSAASGNLTLTWGSSCAASDTDYEIYEGTLGSYYSHTQKFCTTGGATTKTFPQPAGSTYYLVVPKNAVSEGSYGQASSGAEIPQGAAACAPRQIALSCP
jgi:hypothetical protein